MRHRLTILPMAGTGHAPGHAGLGGEGHVDIIRLPQGL